MSTPACVALDQAGVDYTVHPYEHDPSSESYGLEAAELLGLDPALVFKTLMARLDTGELVVAIVPVDCRLDLKQLAAAAGTKRAQMADVADAERSSGYVAGGISPFGQRTARRTFVDDSATAFERMYVSGGRRGFDLGVAASDLLAITEAVVAPLRS